MLTDSYVLFMHTLNIGRHKVASVNPILEICFNFTAEMMHEGVSGRNR